MSDACGANDPDARPVLRVVRGEPTAEELAVLTALATRSADATAPQPVALRGRWNDPAHSLRRTPSPGPGAWRASLR